MIKFVWEKLQLSSSKFTKKSFAEYLPVFYLHFTKRFCRGLKCYFSRKYVDDSETVFQRSFVKEMFLKISQNSQENTLSVRELLKKSGVFLVFFTCFPVNLAKFSRTPFLLNTSGDAPVKKNLEQ